MAKQQTDTEWTASVGGVTHPKQTDAEWTASLGGTTKSPTATQNVQQLLQRRAAQSPLTAKILRGIAPFARAIEPVTRPLAKAEDWLTSGSTGKIGGGFAAGVADPFVDAYQTARKYVPGMEHAPGVGVRPEYQHGMSHFLGSLAGYAAPWGIAEKGVSAAVPGLAKLAEKGLAGKLAAGVGKQALTGAAIGAATTGTPKGALEGGVGAGIGAGVFEGAAPALGRVIAKSKAGKAIPKMTTVAAKRIAEGVSRKGKLRGGLSNLLNRQQRTSDSNIGDIIMGNYNKAKSKIKAAYDDLHNVAGSTRFDLDFSGRKGHLKGELKDLNLSTKGLKEGMEITDGARTAYTNRLSPETSEQTYGKIIKAVNPDSLDNGISPHDNASLSPKEIPKEVKNNILDILEKPGSSEYKGSQIIGAIRGHKYDNFHKNIFEIPVAAKDRVREIVAKHDNPVRTLSDIIEDDRNNNTFYDNLLRQRPDLGTKTELKARDNIREINQQSLDENINRTDKGISPNDRRALKLVVAQMKTAKQLNAETKSKFDYFRASKTSGGGKGKVTPLAGQWRNEQDYNNLESKLAEAGDQVPKEIPNPANKRHELVSQFLPKLSPVGTKANEQSSLGRMKQLGEMLGNQHLAKTAIKRIMFSKYLNPNEPMSLSFEHAIKNVYNKLNSDDKDFLFSKREKALFERAKKINWDKTNKGLASSLAEKLAHHYVMTSIAGTTLGSSVGHPIAGALIGGAASQLAPYIERTQSAEPLRYVYGAKKAPTKLEGLIGKGKKAAREGIGKIEKRYPKTIALTKGLIKTIPPRQRLGGITGATLTGGNQ